jgi:hypothetical protein
MVAFSGNKLVAARKRALLYDPTDLKDQTLLENLKRIRADCKGSSIKPRRSKAIHK